MAAEKLTRARLAQIIVMLLILVAAFTWRTFRHKVYTFSKCNVNKCEFLFNAEKISIIEIDGGYLLKGQLEDVDIKLSSTDGMVSNSSNRWQVQTDDNNINILLTNQDNSEIVRLNLQK
ncbi:hypothetical protein QWZ04_02440 [Vibrio tapetis subsp. quintayensis]|uniref:hypothetical protein n=1 Tax=Vibrio tapetis TaxID=52443 RepID=UPI0025B3D2C6|nr:hypothetical protein [Vibrio tapetis]MDN3679184.1 hypothetical protein [Vibrio tapetis subsp. quintayensis]